MTIISTSYREKSDSVLYLVKRKAATETAGGSGGRGQQVNPSSSRYTTVLCLISGFSWHFPSPRERRLMAGFVTSRAGGHAVCVFVYPTAPQGSRKQKQSKCCWTWLPCQPTANADSSGGFASLGRRCCFPVSRLTTDKNKPQADKWAKIICYF